MQTEIDAVSVVWFHDRQLRERDWPVMSHGASPGVWEWIDANHRYNGLLWREEDRARRLDVPPAEIAAGKRARLCPAYFTAAQTRCTSS